MVRHWGHMMKVKVLVVALCCAIAVPCAAAVVNKYRYDVHGRVIIADQSITSGSGHTANHSYDRVDNRHVVDTASVVRSVWLPSNSILNRAQSVISQDGRYRFTMQRDGEAVLFDARGRRLWGTGTAGQGGVRLRMQADGNLVIYTEANVPLWASGTQQNPGAQLAVQTDGSVVIYLGSTPLWGTGGCNDCN